MSKLNNGVYWDEFWFRWNCGKESEKVLDVYDSDDIEHDSFKIIRNNDKYYIFTSHRTQNSSWYGQKISEKEKEELIQLYEERGFWNFKRKAIEILDKNQF